jgi:hypothetical protein
MAAAPPIFIAETLDRCVADWSSTSFDAVDADEVPSSRCAANATSASARRRGRMMVTSDASNPLSGAGEWADVSPKAGCDDGSTACSTPQKEQNLAASTIELPHFRQSMSFSLVRVHR